MTFLSVVFGIFSYQVFTKSMLNENAEYTRAIAEYASLDVSEWPFEQYLEMGAKRMEELSGIGNLDDLDDATKGTIRSYGMISSDLTYLSGILNILEIGLLVPDPSSDYSKATVVYDRKERGGASLLVLSDEL